MHPLGQSPSDLDDIIDICVDRCIVDAGELFDAHTHEFHQLTWSPRGVISIAIDDCHWSLPTTLALWIPAGVRHRVGALRSAAIHTLYVRTETCPFDWGVVTVPMGALQQAVAIELGRDDLLHDHRARLEAVLFDHLRPLEECSIQIPLPLDERAARIAHALTQDPGDTRTLESWGREVGASERTLSRVFTAETGLAFTEWRRQARIRGALSLLAAGTAVSVVASMVGYRDTSSFIVAFRRATGYTPATHPVALGKAS